MPAHSIRSAFAIIFVAVTGTFSLAACDQAEPVERGQPIHLTFTQRDLVGQTVAELGTYTVSRLDQPVLQGAMSEEIVLEGHGGHMSYGRVGGDPAKEVVAFLLTFDGRTGDVHYRGGAIVPGVRSSPIEPTPAAGGTEDTFRGTLYGFFVEGIGDRPDVPVEVVLHGTKEGKKLVIDPEEHTLPARFAFHLSEDDVALAEEGTFGRQALPEPF